MPKLRIWEDGKMEIAGGRLTLPLAVSIEAGPAKISVTAIDFGTSEFLHNGVMRKYNYFGFSGALNVSPGGVDAQGNGIRYFFTRDNDPLHHFLQIDGIAISIHLPGDVDKKDAKILIEGFLTMANPQAGSGQGQADPSTEYIGGVKFHAKLKEGGSIGGGAAMRLNPSVPAFLIDANLQFSSPIPLGSTGLGIYGFRGLIGHRYVPSKSAVGVSEESTWWAYYKAPDEGVNVDYPTDYNTPQIGQAA